MAWSAICAVALVPVWKPAPAGTRLMRTSLVVLATIDALFTVHLANRTMYVEDNHFKEIWNRLAREHVSSLDLSYLGLQRLESSPEWTTAEGQPQNKNLLLKIPTFRSYLAFTNRFYADLLDRPILRGMAIGSNRIWFSSRVVTVPPSDSAYMAFVERSEGLGQGVLVVHRRDQMVTSDAPTSTDAVTDISRLPPAIRVAVALKTYTPGELRFEVTCPEHGWLLVTDRWSRGWQATVNGKKADVWGGNFLF